MAKGTEASRKRAFKVDLYRRVAAVPAALANGHRLELLDLLAQRPRTVQDVAAEAGLTVANASQHLQILARAGLVAAERRGAFAFYRTTGTRVHRLLTAMRDVAETHDPTIGEAVRVHTGAGGEIVADMEAARAVLASPRVVLLDARPREEFDAGHLPNAVHASAAMVKAGKVGLSPKRRYLVYCRGPYCTFADEVVIALRKRGLEAARLALGPSDWEAAGGSVQRAG